MLFQYFLSNHGEISIMLFPCNLLLDMACSFSKGEIRRRKQKTGAMTRINCSSRRQEKFIVIFIATLTRSLAGFRENFSVVLPSNGFLIYACSCGVTFLQSEILLIVTTKKKRKKGALRKMASHKKVYLYSNAVDGEKSLISSNNNYFSTILNTWKGAINYQPRCLLFHSS